MCAGGKSKNLASLRRQLPDDISLPSSVALPFGSFERALSEKINQNAAATVRELSKALDKAGADGIPTELAGLRKAVLGLEPPEALVTEVLRSSMTAFQGMPLPMY